MCIQSGAEDNKIVIEKKKAVNITPLKVNLVKKSKTVTIEDLDLVNKTYSIHGCLIFDESSCPGEWCDTFTTKTLVPKYKPEIGVLLKEREKDSGEIVTSIINNSVDLNKIKDYEQVIFEHAEMKCEEKTYDDYSVIVGKDDDAAHFDEKFHKLKWNSKPLKSKNGKMEMGGLKENYIYGVRLRILNTISTKSVESEIVYFKNLQPNRVPKIDYTYQDESTMILNILNVNFNNIESVLIEHQDISNDKSDIICNSYNTANITISKLNLIKNKYNISGKIRYEASKLVGESSKTFTTRILVPDYVPTISCKYSKSDKKVSVKITDDAKLAQNVDFGLEHIMYEVNVFPFDTSQGYQSAALVKSLNDKNWNALSSGQSTNFIYEKLNINHIYAFRSKIVNFISKENGKESNIVFFCNLAPPNVPKLKLSYSTSTQCVVNVKKMDASNESVHVEYKEKNSDGWLVLSSKNDVITISDLDLVNKEYTLRGRFIFNENDFPGAWCDEITTETLIPKYKPQVEAELTQTEAKANEYQIMARISNDSINLNQLKDWETVEFECNAIECDVTKYNEYSQIKSREDCDSIFGSQLKDSNWKPMSDESKEQAILNQLTSNHIYAFRLKVRNTVSNELSPLSNIVYVKYLRPNGTPTLDVKYKNENTIVVEVSNVNMNDNIESVLIQYKDEESKKKTIGPSKKNKIEISKLKLTDKIYNIRGRIQCNESQLLGTYSDELKTILLKPQYKPEIEASYNNKENGINVHFINDSIEIPKILNEMENILFQMKCNHRNKKSGKKDDGWKDIEKKTNNNGEIEIKDCKLDHIYSFRCMVTNVISGAKSKESNIVQFRNLSPSIVPKIEVKHKNINNINVLLLTDLKKYAMEFVDYHIYIRYKSNSSDDKSGEDNKTNDPGTADAGDNSWIEKNFKIKKSIKNVFSIENGKEIDLAKNKYKIEARFCFIESGHFGDYSETYETEMLTPKIIPSMKILHIPKKNNIRLSKDKSNGKWWQNINNDMEKIVFEYCDLEYSLTDNIKNIDFDNTLSNESNWKEVQESKQNESDNDVIIYDQLKENYIVAFRCVVVNIVSDQRGKASEIHYFWNVIPEIKTDYYKNDHSIEVRLETVKKFAKDEFSKLEANLNDILFEYNSARRQKEISKSNKWDRIGNKLKSGPETSALLSECKEDIVYSFRCQFLSKIDNCQTPYSNVVEFKNYKPSKKPEIEIKYKNGNSCQVIASNIKEKMQKLIVERQDADKDGKASDKWEAVNPVVDEVEKEDSSQRNNVIIDGLDMVKNIYSIRAAIYSLKTGYYSDYCDSISTKKLVPEGKPQINAKYISKKNEIGINVVWESVSNMDRQMDTMLFEYQSQNVDKKTKDKNIDDIKLDDKWNVVDVDEKEMDDKIDKQNISCVITKCEANKNYFIRCTLLNKLSNCRGESSEIVRVNTAVEKKVIKNETWTLPSDVENDYSGYDIVVGANGVITTNKWNPQGKRKGKNAGGTLRLKARSINLKSNGIITVSGLGYLGGDSQNTQGYSYDNTKRKGRTSKANFGGGGGGTVRSGGAGGYGTTGVSGTGTGEGGSIYGDVQLTEAHLGSGGGAKGTSKGGTGGGALIIECTSKLEIGANARIKANGTSGKTNLANSGGGAGSGGSIYLKASRIINNGIIEAVGGENAFQGGEGRIRIDCDNSNKEKINQNKGKINPKIGHQDTYTT